MLPVAHCMLFLPDVMKIELLIPLAYFGIVRTLSTETAKIVHFILFFLLGMHKQLFTWKKHHSTVLDHEYVLLHKRSLFETLFVTPILPSRIGYHKC